MTYCKLATVGETASFHGMVILYYQVYDVILEIKSFVPLDNWR